MKPKTSPLPIDRLRSSTATNSPYRLVKWLTSIMDGRPPVSFGTAIGSVVGEGGLGIGGGSGTESAEPAIFGTAETFASAVDDALYRSEAESRTGADLRWATTSVNPRWRSTTGSITWPSTGLSAQATSRSSPTSSGLVTRSARRRSKSWKAPGSNCKPCRSCPWARRPRGHRSAPRGPKLISPR